MYQKGLNLSTPCPDSLASGSAVLSRGASISFPVHIPHRKKPARSQNPLSGSYVF